MRRRTPRRWAGGRDERGHGEAIIVAMARADLAALVEARRGDAVERLVYREFIGAVIALRERDIPGDGEAFGAGAGAQLVGGLLGHPHGAGGARDDAHHRKRGDEIALAPGSPAIVARREGDGGEDEEIVVLGFGRGGRSGGG